MTYRVSGAPLRIIGLAALLATVLGPTGAFAEEAHGGRGGSNSRGGPLTTVMQQRGSDDTVAQVEIRGADDVNDAAEISGADDVNEHGAVSATPAADDHGTESNDVNDN